MTYPQTSKPNIQILLTCTLYNNFQINNLSIPSTPTATNIPFKFTTINVCPSISPNLTNTSRMHDT